MEKRGNGLTGFFARLSGRLQAHRLLFAVVLTAVFAAAGAVCVCSHGLSVSESEMLLAAKHVDLSDVKTLKSDYASPAWLAVLALPARFLPDALSVRFFILGLTVVAVFIFLHRVRLDPLSKALAVFSAAFFWFFPVRLSGFSLLPLAAVLFFAAFPHRFRRPVLYGLALALFPLADVRLAGISAFFALEFLVRFTIRPSARRLAHLSALRDSERKEKSVSSRTVKRNERSVEYARSGFFWIVPALLLVAASVAAAAVPAVKWRAAETSMGVADSRFWDVLDQALFGAPLPLFELSLFVLLLVSFVKDLRLFLNIVVMFGSYLALTLLKNTGLSDFRPYFAGLAMLFLIAAFLAKNDAGPDFWWQRKLREKLSRIQLVRVLRMIPALSAIVFALPVVLTIPNAVVSAVSDRGGAANFFVSYLRPAAEDGGRSLVIADGSGTVRLLRDSLYALPEGDAAWDLGADRAVAADPEAGPAAGAESDALLEDAEVKRRIDALLEKYDHVYYLELAGSCPNAGSRYGAVLDGYAEHERDQYGDLDTELFGASAAAVVSYKLK